MNQQNPFFDGQTCSSFSVPGCEASHGADQPAFWTPQRGNRASGGDVGNCDSKILLPPEI